MATTAALIVAAGRGHRVGGPLPKQYRELAGRAVLGHSVRRFATHPRVDRVRVVIDPADRALYDDAVQGSEEPEAGTLLAPVAGGATRQESVRNGLESLAEAPPDLVLIHDGARPLVSEAVIDGALDALAGHDGALPALAVSDSLKRAAPGSVLVAGAVAREGLWRAQTPQGFRYPAILDAHRAAAGAALSDDAAVAEQAGLSVALTAGDEDNLKITTEQDFSRAECIMAARDESAAAAAHALETRVGMGFDVHRFGPGDHLMLGGVAVPHDHGVVSHSDGDVVLHAIVDAVLGAIAAGDIGTHFPPSDDAWRDADSARFVAHTLDLLKERGGRLDHVDVTLICQRPRIGPHRAAMVARLAAVLGLPAARISLKATTTERLGFTGRGEGIAAQAVATVRLPAGAAMTADAGSTRLDLRDPATLVATWFGAGLARWAPGTAASALALPVAWLLRSYTGELGLAIAALVLFGIGVWAAEAYERRTGVRDSPAIVVDEVVGQWIAFLLVPADPVAYGIGFVLFRLIDVAKPWPIGLIDRHVKGGFGVMLDDVIAGVFAAVVLWNIWVWL